MKYFTSFAFTLLCFLASFSQTGFNKAYQAYNDNASHLIEINGNYYFTARVISPVFQDDFRVLSVDAAGNTRFVITINKNEYTTATRLIRTLDNKIAMIGYGNRCDYNEPTAQTFFIKLNENGNILFDNSFSHINSGNLDHLRDLVQYSDSSYFAITDSVLFHFNKNGVLISKKSAGLSKLIAMDLRPDGKLLLSNGSGSAQPMLTVIDTTATIVNQYTVSTVSSRPVVKNLQTTYTIDGTIRKRNIAAQIVASSQTAQGTGTLTSYSLINDTIYACGYKSNSTSFVICMDTSLNILSYIGDTTRNVGPASIIANGNRITLLNNCKSQPAGNGIVGLSSFPKNADYHFTQDIGVVNAQLDSAYARFIYSVSQNIYESGILYYRFRFTVKNFGTNPVSSFKINSMTAPGLVCGIGYYTEQFNTSPIAPGATHTVTSEWIPRLSIPNTGALGSVISISNAQCYNTSLPDNANDAAILNDSYCSSFTFTTTVTGIDELQEGAALKLFPNPANKQLIVSCNVPMQKLSIYDISGRTLSDQELHNSLDQELNVGELAPGIYFLHIETEKGITTRKFVKE